MFVSIAQHDAEVGRLTAALRDRELRIAAMEQHLSELERTRHDLVEWSGYVITSAADPVRDSDAMCSEQLRAIGQALPYLLTGRRTWDGPEMQNAAEAAISRVQQLAVDFGLSMPDDPVRRVHAMLCLAMVLFNPVHSVPIDSYRLREHTPA